MTMLYISLAFLLISSCWALVYCWNFPAAVFPDAKFLSAVRLVPVGFILTMMLYMLPPCLQLLLVGNIDIGVDVNLSSYVAYFPLAIIFCAIFIVVFSIVYKASVFTFIRRPYTKSLFGEIPPVLYWGICFVFFVLCLYMLVSLSASVGGILNFVLMGYGVTSLFNSSSAAVVGIPWLLTLSILMIVEAKRRKYKLLYFVSVSLIVILSLSLLIMGRRGQLVGYGLSLILVYHFQYKSLTLKKVMVMLFSGFLILNMVGLLRGDSYKSLNDAFDSLTAKADAVSSSGRMNLFYTLTKGNFVAPFQSFPNVILHAGDDVDFQYLRTMVSGFSLLVPQAIWEGRPEPLANWYMKRFVNANADDNQGLQFFFLSESYLDFGPFGVLFWGILYGVLFASICTFFCRRFHSSPYLVFFCLFIGNYLNFVSSDTFGGLVVFMKSVAAPCLILLFISHFGRRMVK